MARPRQQLLSPQIIAEAALRLVSKHGDFTIPGVANALGVHPSSLYHHIPGGRRAIVHHMRDRLYATIDLGPALDHGRSPLERLREWMRAYRTATAAAPAAVPVLVGAPVDDRRTLEIYEALFAILKDAGVPTSARVACSAMLDAIVLGSAIDAASPVPLWVPFDQDLPEMLDVAVPGDDHHRAVAGFDLAIEAAVAAIARMAEPGATRQQSAS